MAPTKTRRWHHNKNQTSINIWGWWLTGTATDICRAPPAANNGFLRADQAHLQPGSRYRARQCRQDCGLHPSPGARRAGDDPIGVWPRTDIAGQDRRVQGHAAGYDLQRLWPIRSLDEQLLRIPRKWLVFKNEQEVAEPARISDQSLPLFLQRVLQAQSKLLVFSRAISMWLLRFQWVWRGGELDLDRCKDSGHHPKRLTF